MAYFPNSTAGMDFEDRYCCRCVNYRERKWMHVEGDGCPIWDLHLLLDQYGACNAEPSVAPQDGGLAVTKYVLDYLIEDGPPQRCSMFVPDGKDHDTLPLPGVTS